MRISDWSSDVCSSVYYLTPNDTTYRRNSDLDQNIYNRRQVFGAILNIEQQIGDLSLTSLTSYTERKNRIRWDLDYSSIDGLWVFQEDPVRTKVFTQEIRLQSDNKIGRASCRERVCQSV